MTRVTLRSLMTSDRAQLFNWRKDPEVAAAMYTDHEITPAEHAHWFNELFWTGACHHYWIIEANGEPAGLINLADFDRNAQTADWGMYLGEAEWRGKGVALAADYWLFNRVFDDMGFRKMTCEIIAGIPGLYEMRKSEGWVEEGRLRQHCMKGGEWRDVFRLGMLREEWFAARPEVERRLRKKNIEPDLIGKPVFEAVAAA